MSARKLVTGIGFAIALATPIAVLAEVVWETTSDEAGSRIVVPQFGTTPKSVSLPAVKPLRAGDVSLDRQYVFLGDEGGWQLRPMENRFEGGRLVHVDDPVGHMQRVADNSPLTADQRLAWERIGGR
ncbi:MAG: hypothetical protein IPH30_00960 [Betaproteobacteria bacterium]|nr:hypothetical protein [Betaproteobacteria bacterium]